MTIEEWWATLPDYVKQDAIWNFTAYRMASYLYDLAWRDCDILRKDPRGMKLAGQLIASAGSMPANIEEGYGRGFGKQYAFHLRVALGSCRETQGWYLRSRHLLPPETVQQRYLLSKDIGRLLLTEIKRQRSQAGH